MYNGKVSLSLNTANYHPSLKTTWFKDLSIYTGLNVLMLALFYLYITTMTTFLRTKLDS